MTRVEYYKHAPRSMKICPYCGDPHRADEACSKPRTPLPPPAPTPPADAPICCPACGQEGQWVMGDYPNLQCKNADCRVERFREGESPNV